MKLQDIRVGEWYRLKHASEDLNGKYYGWAKVLRIYKSNSKYNSWVECQFSRNKNDVAGFIRYFSPEDLIKVE